MREGPAEVWLVMVGRGEGGREGGREGVLRARGGERDIFGEWDVDF